MQPKIVKQYLKPVDIISMDFIEKWVRNFDTLEEIDILQKSENLYCQPHA